MNSKLMKPDHLNYFHCQGDDCDFKSHRIRHLAYFKGRFLCVWCRKKSVSMNIPKSNPSLATLKKLTRLPEGRNLPKDKYKDYIKVTEPLKTWAEKSSKPSRQLKIKGKITYTGLTLDEYRLLKSHFDSLGFTYQEREEKINEIKEHIKKAHEEYKNGLKNKPVNFQEEFNKLVVKNVN